MPLPVTLKLPWAPSANQIWRNHSAGQVYLAKKYQVFLEQAYYAWLAQGAPHFKSKAAQVALYLYPPSAHGYDVDNRIKPTLDALTKIGFWKDDRIVRKVSASAERPVEGGAIIVVADALVEGQDPNSQAFINKYNLKPFKLKSGRNAKRTNNKK